MTDRAAGGPASAGLEAHLEACADCRLELLALREALGVADAALAGIASAEPSPEFRARLRQRLDEAHDESADVGVSWRWPWLATAATICAAVVAAVLWRGGAIAPPPLVSVAASAPATTTTTQPASIAGHELLVPSGSPQASAAGGTVRKASVGLASPVSRRAPLGASRSVQPEVLVPAGEQQALLQFVALVHAQGASPAALLAAGQASPDLAEPRDIRIEPLEIAPLDPAEAQGM